MVATQDLVLLGLLKERPLHGYELRQIVEERLSQVASIPPGTLYYTLKKLEKAGLIVRTVERTGNRPERQVFALTPAGEEAFRALLKEALFLEERAYYVFDAALYFFPHLDERDLEAAIEKRLERIDAFRRHVASLTTTYPGRWPFHLEALRKKAELLTGAMGAWYRSLGDDLQARQRRRAGATAPLDEHPVDESSVDENPDAIPA